jgi:hypothetical protein
VKNKRKNIFNLAKLFYMLHVPHMRKIYFAQLGDDGPIKVGVSDNVPARIRHLGKEWKIPIKLLAEVEGDVQDERAIHAYLARSRLHGEWFKSTKRVLKTVDMVKQGFMPEAAQRISRKPKWAPSNIRQLAISLGITSQRLTYWIKVRKVPAEFVLAMEAATGVPKWEIRPDIFPKSDG